MNPFQFFILSLSSAGGLGYAPKAPGTFGTLAAIPLWWLMAQLGFDWVSFLGATVVFTAVAIAIANQAELLYDEHDSGKIVIAYSNIKGGLEGVETDYYDFVETADCFPCIGGDMCVSLQYEEQCLQFRECIWLGEEGPGCDEEPGYDFDANI